MQLEEPKVAEPMTKMGANRGRRLKKLTCFLLLVLPLAGGQTPKGWREFASAQAGYVVSYPRSWHVFESGLQTLYISSFSPSRAVRAVVVPQNGATISLVPAPAGIKDIEQWIAKDSAVSRVKSRNQFTLQRSQSETPLNISEVIFESIEGPDTTRWYFEISGRLLAANLSYWKEDPNAEKHRQVLREVVVSAKVLRPEN
jgi:hypothetical protein